MIGLLLPDGVVKGGSSLKLRYGDKETRYTTDLDATRAEELDAYIRKLDDALREGWNGFTGRVVSRQPARPKNVPGEYIMQPFDIKLEYNHASWVTVQFELGHDEIGGTDKPDFWIAPEIVTMFEELGFCPHSSDPQTARASATFLPPTVQIPATKAKRPEQTTL